MKVLLVNGSPNKNGCTKTALDEMVAVFEKSGIQTEILHLGVKPLGGCMGCGKCRDNENGCIFRDVVSDISKRIDEFDGLVIGSPVHFAGPSANVQCFCDRLFYSSSAKMRGKVAACVVSARRGGTTAAFDRLNKYFTIANMVVATSQYWNQVHGSTPEDVKKDIEGLQIMRTLASNMTWLMKCIEAGKKAGVPDVEYQPITRTNFI